MRFALPLLAALALATLLPNEAAAARKRGPGKPTPDRTEENCQGYEGDQLEACRVIGKYLDLGKQQKWGEVKKLIHPKTLEAIAQTKKTAGEESHPMAPWYWAKNTYLVTDWKVGEIVDSVNGTVQLIAKETRYQVEEDGFSEEEESTYLAGKYQGKWYVADVQRGGGTFSPASITAGLKGYFDEVKKADKPEGEDGAEAAPKKSEGPKIEMEAKPSFEAMGD
jgi:hypothetical protein